MEQFITEIESYCDRADIKPQRLLRDVLGASWGQWDQWKAGAASPTLRNVDRLRAHMAEHPPERAEDAA